MIVRSAIVPSRRNTPCSLILGLLLAAGISAPVFAATLSVQVLDGRDGAPLDGAYVQVGPAPGVPFAGNIDFTDTNGMVTFDDPAITGPQTVTAAADGFARLSLLDAVTGSVVVRLSREVPQGGIYGPSAEISGTVTGIATTNNDGNFDIGFVYPAVQLIDLLRQNLDIEIPADTVNFPVVGDVVIPGNVVVPNQIEFLIFNFSKPLYHFFIGDGSTYDFVSLAARIPTSALQLPLDEAINQAVMREIGIERQIPVSGNQVLNINSDIDLTRNLTVNVPEAPNGTTIQVAAVADVPNPSGVRTIYFDLKTGLRDAGGSFLLSGRNPTGDLSDAVPYLAGSYGDSSTADAFSAGRVDRSSLVLPATRTLGDFFLLPDLTQNGAQYEWSDVARPGITPDPTWAMGSFRLEPVTPGDGSVTTQNLWDVWSVADAFALTLPTLSGAAPGGIPDVGGTAEDDQIVWDHLLADPSGDIQTVLDESITSASRFSRRKIAVNPATTDVADGIVRIARPELAFQASPNPVGADLRVRWNEPTHAGEPIRWTIADAAGRRVSAGDFTASGSSVDRLGAAPDLPAGLYWLRLRRADRTGVTRIAIGLR